MRTVFKTLALLALSGTLSISTALAQNCEGASDKFEEEECLGLVLADEDARLNDAYRSAMRAARRFDADFGIPVPAANSLRQAQRAWIPYRDAACAAETSPAVVGGGGFLRAERTCLIAYTRARTDDLLRLEDRLR